MARLEARLAAARTRLLRGDAVGATADFESLTTSRWTAERARAGRALAAALSGNLSFLAAWSGSRDGLLSFPLGRLAEEALARRRYAAAEAFAGEAGRAGDPLAALYRAAAELEESDLSAAGRSFSERPRIFGATGLGRRVEAALALRREGARALVRDRRGELVGSIDAAGSFAAASPDETRWLPPIAIDALRPPRPFPGLRLAIDADLSRLAAGALEGHRGTIVLLEPRSGDVLAAVSDPRTLARARGGTPAWQQRREPASISKLVTTAAAFQAGLDPDVEIARMTCEGSERLDGGTLWCSYKAGPLAGLDHALAVSCNVAFANLGLEVGRPGLIAELRRFGFDGPEPWAGQILRTDGNEYELARLAIGLDVTDITPLHAALLAAVFADQGRMPEPVLLTAEDGWLGLSPRSLPHPAGRPVVDPRWIPRFLEAMEAVAIRGTGAGLAPRGFPIAMKTGTAAAWHLGYHVNYIGFGPLPRPGVAFCVRVTHQPTSHRVNRAAREVTRRLLDGLAARQTQGRLPAR